MAWIGARPYECDRSHWFAVMQHAGQPRLCPLCGTETVRYTGDADVPIFVLQVDDVWGITRGGQDEDEDEDEIYPFRELSVGNCIEVGSDVETPWDAVEALAEMALEGKASPAG